MVVLLEDVENRGSDDTDKNPEADDTDKNPEAEGEMGLYMMPFRTLFWRWKWFYFGSSRRSIEPLEDLNLRTPSTPHRHVFLSTLTTTSCS
jgi:hypothetical protein